MKQCSKCLKIKAPSDFKTTGRRCLACIAEYNSRYSKERFSRDPEFRARKIQSAKSWAIANPDKRATIARKRNKKAYDTNPLKVIARACIGQQVKRGTRLAARYLSCECGKPAAHYHHHKGYAKEFRYDVVPLCVDCHRKADS